MGENEGKIQIPEVVLARMKAENAEHGVDIPDEELIRQIEASVREQVGIFVANPSDVRMDIETAERILGDPEEAARAHGAHLVVGLVIIEAARILEAASIEGLEISIFVNELVTMQRASAFADELYGSPWDVSPAPHGWRREVQEWAKQRGLIKPIIGPGGGQYTGFTRKGEVLVKELHRCGHTIFVKPVP